MIPDHMTPCDPQYMVMVSRKDKIRSNGRFTSRLLVQSYVVS